RHLPTRRRPRAARAACPGGPRSVWCRRTACPRPRPGPAPRSLLALPEQLAEEILDAGPDGGEPEAEPSDRLGLDRRLFGSRLVGDVGRLGRDHLGRAHALREAVGELLRELAAHLGEQAATELR